MRGPALPVAALLTTAACGGAPGERIDTSTRDSAGIVLVDNRGADRPLSWRLSEVAVIAAGDGDADFTQLDEYTVAADTLGRIFVADAWFGQRVQLIDTLGQVVRRLTRGGGGPGEIGQAVAISASPDGVLNVMDMTKTGIVRVTADGAPLPLLSMAGYDLYGGARVTADTVVVHTLDSRTSALVEEIRYRTDRDTATLVVHAPQRLGWLGFCNTGLEGLTPMLAPEIRWTARGALVAVQHTDEYRVEEFRGGRLFRVVRRQVPRIPGNTEAVRRFFPEGKIVASPDCVVPPDELVAKRGVVSRVQPVRRLALDPEGRLWVERNTFPDEPAQTDVFLDGRYLGTLTGLGTPLGFPASGLLVFALPDSTTDLPKLAIYRASLP